MSQLSSSELEIPLNYSPKPKQSIFHTNAAKYRLYIGAWRAGKTYAGCQEVIKKCMLFPGNLVLVGRKDFTDLRDTTMKTFLEGEAMTPPVCPPDFIQSYNKTEHNLKCVNGSEILFRELKDGKGLGSLDLGAFYIDEAEQVEESIFERLKGRLSRKGVGRPCGWLTSNPPNEDHWLHRQFEQVGDPDFFTIHASTYENKEHLPEGYIEDLEKLPPSWRKKYVEGQYGFTPDGTPYYSGYNELLHKTKLQWNPALPLDCGWDFGKLHPAFVVTQWDRVYWKVLAELLGSNITIHNFVDLQVIPFLNQRFPNANFRHFGDPACRQVNDKSEFTSYQILKSKGIQIKYKQSEYRQRQEIIEKKLNTMEAGMPTLQVDSSCKIVNDGFLGGYHYPLHKSDQAFGQKFELPFKDGFYEHLMNALEYVAVHLFNPIGITRPTRRRELEPVFEDNI